MEQILFKHMNFLASDHANYSKLVIDTGSYMMKVGYNENDGPRNVDYTMIGRKLPEYPLCVVGCGQQKDTYVGSEAYTNSPILSIDYPIHRGLIKNWEDYETLLCHIMSFSLYVCPEDHGVFMPYYPNNPISNACGITQILFETFNVPRMMLSVEEIPIFELYLAGKGTTGLLVDCGGGLLRVYPIYESKLLTSAIGKWNFGGEDVTDNLQKLLSSKYFFQTSDERLILDNLKKEKTFISQNYMEDLRKYKEHYIVQEYTLPDGSTIELGSEIFEASETYFHPQEGDSFPGIHNAIFQTILKCNMEIRMELCKNIVLTGASIIKGMDVRIKNELSNFLDNNLVNVKILFGNKYSSWTASSFACGIESIDAKFVTKDDYDEYGPNSVFMKTKT